MINVVVYRFRADTGVCPYAYIFPEVGVTPCGYQPDYMHGESHFRADTGVCPYGSKFPGVGVTPCGYPLVCVHGRHNHGWAKRMKPPAKMCARSGDRHNRGAGTIRADTGVRPYDLICPQTPRRLLTCMED